MRWDIDTVKGSTPWRREVGKDRIEAGLSDNGHPDVDYNPFRGGGDDHDRYPQYQHSPNVANTSRSAGV